MLRYFWVGETRSQFETLWHVTSYFQLAKGPEVVRAVVTKGSNLFIFTWVKLILFATHLGMWRNSDTRRIFDTQKKAFVVVYSVWKN